MKNYKKLLKEKEYDFLRENEHLKDKIMFLCLGGSLAYGTNIPTSDIDIRGIALNSESDLLGTSEFDQFIDKKTDTVIYSVSKFFSLVTRCNPNIIEMLFCRPEDYLYISPLGQKLIDNRYLFLTKRAFFSFGGYANGQLNKLENALSLDAKVITLKERQIHINRSVKNVVRILEDKYNFSHDQVKSYVGLATIDGVQTDQILVDFNLKEYPLANLVSVMGEMTNVLRDYKKQGNNRNNKKDAEHLNKHMMHLMRLYFMSNEILSTGDLHTFRTVEHQFLMDVRNGRYRTENGGVKKEFYEMIEKLEKDTQNSYKDSFLPERVDFKKANNLLIEINKKGLLI